MDNETRAAFERLLRIALTDTHQANRVANFVLAWWNAESLGGFDLADLFAVDAAIAARFEQTEQIDFPFGRRAGQNQRLGP